MRIRIAHDRKSAIDGRAAATYVGGTLHRTTIAVPHPVIAEALELGRRAGLPSLNAVVQAALEEFSERRRREAFAAAVAEMGNDPDILRESALITQLFAPADRDGIG